MVYSFTFHESDRLQVGAVPIIDFDSHVVRYFCSGSRRGRGGRWTFAIEVKTANTASADGVVGEKDSTHIE